MVALSIVLILSLLYSTLLLCYILFYSTSHVLLLRTVMSTPISGVLTFAINLIKTATIAINLIKTATSIVINLIKTVTIAIYLIKTVTIIINLIKTATIATNKVYMKLGLRVLSW